MSRTNLHKKYKLGFLFLAASLGVAVLGGSAYSVSQYPNEALLVAARAGFAPAVKFLVSLGANPKPENLDDEPLWRAAISGHTETVKALLDSGADIHANEDFSLIVAAEFGHIETVIVLLDGGADIHAKNDSALHWAARSGHTEIVALLVDRGADIHANDDDALRWAVFNGHTETVTLLLARGANPHASNDESLRIAMRNEHPEIISILQSYMGKSQQGSRVPVDHIP